ASRLPASRSAAVGRHGSGARPRPAPACDGAFRCRADRHGRRRLVARGDLRRSRPRPRRRRLAGLRPGGGNVVGDRRPPLRRRRGAPLRPAAEHRASLLRGGRPLRADRRRLGPRPARRLHRGGGVDARPRGRAAPRRGLRGGAQRD
ncbi:MAG: hypothetical protein AVDCRST_MAG65-382, partial [uncultured Solirubrobacteraceae bacterium]